jgi:DNA-binding transcriptional LysR family regulator
MRGVEYSELLVLVEVARGRSFRHAATRLAQSPSSVSHTIRSLEERLGAKLLNRTTRSVSPTEAGQLLLDRIAPAFLEIDAAVAAVHDFRDRPVGVVRINVPSVAAEILLTPVLSRFVQTYPDVRLEITMEDSFVDIVEGGFDVGIRLGEHLHRDMIGVRLTSDLTLAIVCSPDYLSDKPTPKTPNDLRNHACLMYRFEGNRHVYAWPLRHKGETIDFLVDGVITTNNLGMIMSSCLGGAGIACLVSQMVDSYVEQGKLIRILNDWCESFPGFFLYYSSRQMSAAVRAFVDFLQEQSSVQGLTLPKTL